MIGFSRNHQKDTKSSPSAFVLMNCFGGEIDSTVLELEKIDKVTDVRKINGPYDIIATLQTESGDDLTNVLMQQLKEIKTVKSSITLRSGDGIKML